MNSSRSFLFCAQNIGHFHFPQAHSHHLKHTNTHLYTNPRTHRSTIKPYRASANFSFCLHPGTYVRRTLFLRTIVCQFSSVLLFFSFVALVPRLPLFFFCARCFYLSLTTLQLVLVSNVLSLVRIHAAFVHSLAHSFALEHQSKFIFDFRVFSPLTLLAIAFVFHPRSIFDTSSLTHTHPPTLIHTKSDVAEKC